MNGVERIQAAFAALRDKGRGGLSVYLVAGHPDLVRSEAHMDAALAGGADWLEFGIPFSDPAADGPAIQAASAQALRAGLRVADALAMATRLRSRHDAPLVAMTYANIAHRMGWGAWAKALAGHGLDGCILPDVPLEESGPVRAALAEEGLAWIPLVTPTTPAARMTAIAATATGFLYVVGNVGITGQADPGPLVEATVRRARDAAPDLAIAVGFGIASPDDVRRVLEAGADAAIVGSALVRPISEGATPEETGQAVAALVAAT